MPRPWENPKNKMAPKMLKTETLACGKNYGLGFRVYRV